MKQTTTFLVILIIGIISVSAQEIPSPRFGHFSFSIYDTVSQQNVFYIFGGYTMGGNSKNNLKNTKREVQEESGELYKLQGNNFSKFSIVGPAVNQPCLVYSNGVAIYFANLRGNSFFYSIDPDILTMIATCDSVVPLPNGLQNVAKSGMANKNSDEFFIIGGKNQDNDSVVFHTWTFNQQTKTFAQSPYDIPQGGRYGFATFETATDVFILGGRGSDHNINGTPLVLSKQYKSWDIPTCQGNFPSFVSDPVFTTYNGTLFVAGGQGYNYKKSTYKKSTLEDEVIATKFYKITANGTILTGTILTNEFPPIFAGTAWVNVEGNDTLFYTFGGISEITSTGDTTVTNNFYRYNITESIVEQYHEDTQNWGNLITSINETEFDKNVNLQIYPNPATSEISLAIPNNESIVSIKIYNQNGQLIRIIRNKPSNAIQINDLNSGLYFVRVDTDKKYYCGKIIKQ